MGHIGRFAKKIEFTYKVFLCVDQVLQGGRFQPLEC